MVLGAGERSEARGLVVRAEKMVPATPMAAAKAPVMAADGQTVGSERPTASRVVGAMVIAAATTSMRVGKTGS